MYVCNNIKLKCSCTTYIIRMGDIERFSYTRMRTIIVHAYMYVNTRTIHRASRHMGDIIRLGYLAGIGGTNEHYFSFK